MEITKRISRKIKKRIIMSKQMTAVNWLIDKIYFQRVTVNRELLDQAIEIEKQQIIDACNQIEVIGLDHELPGEKYYNETFNK